MNIIPDNPDITVVSESEELILGTMPLQAWLNIADHPRRRDTEAHAQAPHWQSARTATGVTRAKLAHVTAALHNNTLYKIEGHTRAYLWEKGGLPAPDRIHATIFKVHSQDELNEVYGLHDVQSAARTTTDVIFGAYRENKLRLTSPRLRDGRIADALNLALRGATRANQPSGYTALDLYKAVAVFPAELKQFDSLKPKSDIFLSGLVAAGLIGLSLYGTHAKSFLARIAEHDVTPNSDGLLDPAQAVLSLIIESYHEEITAVGGSWVRDSQEDLLARSLRGLTAWVDHHRDPEAGSQFWFKNQLRAVSPDRYTAQLKQRKGIIHEPDL